MSTNVVPYYLRDRSSPLERLSPRERQVLELRAYGHNNKVIAQILGVSPRTAEGFRNRLYEKMNWKTTADLITYAWRNGVVS